MIKVFFTEYPLKKQYPDDAGYDIHSLEEKTLKPFEWHAFKTGIYLQMPAGIFAQVLPRSGLAAKHAIMILGGVIDAGYRGEIRVILYNAGNEPITIHPGDRIAQIVFIKLADELVTQELVTQEYIEQNILASSERGAKGFGSTGR